MTMVMLAHHFLVRLRHRLEPRGGDRQQATEESLPDPVVCLDELPPSLLPQAEPPRTPTLPQVRWLLRAALPVPVLDVALALALVAYTQRRNLAAYRSHRKRTLRQLTMQGS